MKFLQKIKDSLQEIKMLAVADHRSIQLLFSVLWIFHGVLTLVLNKPAYNFLISGISSPAINGAALLCAGLLGFAGVLRNNIRFSVVFGIFTLFKSIELLVAVIHQDGTDNYHWAHNSVETIAALLLLWKILSVSYFTKSRKIAQANEVK